MQNNYFVSVYHLTQLPSITASGKGLNCKYKSPNLNWKKGTSHIILTTCKINFLIWDFEKCTTSHAHTAAVFCGFMHMCCWVVFYGEFGS